MGIQRILSLVVPAVNMFILPSEMKGYTFAGPSIIGLALIWFGDDLGELSGIYVNLRYVDRKSPGSLMRFMGWVFLFLPGLVLLLS